jgi:tryptophan 7-halogenase
MRVAVLGGGTAGFMAAAHLTKHFPYFDLYHIYDSSIPTIGVGEGTTPPFVRWLHDITGMTFEALQTRCFITRKDGIRFENWGQSHQEYVHYFSLREGHAYHLSAGRLVELLRDYVAAVSLDARVTGVFSDGHCVTVTLGNREHFTFDFVFDARGFPDPSGNACEVLIGIPTNEALISRTPLRSAMTETRAVARPFGWVFVIPLTVDTAYGYIFNGALTSRDEIEHDLRWLLAAEGLEPSGPFKHIRFPNFIRRRLFDGSLFAIGNAASFVEPLEATAIAVVLEELRIASYWLLDQILSITKADQFDRSLAVVNDHLFNFVEQVALFVSWHYARGSSFDTSFWRHARCRSESFRKQAAPLAPRCDFEAFVASAAEWPRELAFVRTREEFELIPFARESDEVCGGFLKDSFAKVGHGIAYFESRENDPEPRARTGLAH